MAQLGSVQSSNTFLQWLSHANKAYTRLDQFAVNESALYANTITANVEFLIERSGYGSGRIITDADGLKVRGDSGKVLKLGSNATDVTTIEVSGVISHTANMTFTDDSQIHIGTGGDLKIYHDGNHSYIDDNGGTGNLYIKATNFHLTDQNGESKVGMIGDGAVTLYHDNSSPKLATETGGVAVTGTMTANAVTVDHGDITVTGSGNRAIGITSVTGLATMEIGGETGAFIDFKDPATDDFDMRIGTTASGGYINTAGSNLSITANTTFSRLVTHSANSTHNDSVRAFFGSDNDAHFRHDDANFYHYNGKGNTLAYSDTFQFFSTTGSETFAQFNHNGAINLYYDNALKFETMSTGTKTTGEIYVAGDTATYDDTPQAAGLNFYYESDTGIATIGSYSGGGGTGLEIRTNAGGAANERALYFDGAGRSTFYANTSWGDNIRTNYGAGNDGSIYSDGANFTFASAAEHHYSDAFQWSKGNATETIMTAVADGAVTLYYDNTARVATTATGLDVSGRVAEDQWINGSASGNQQPDFSLYKNLFYTLIGNITLQNSFTSTNAVGQTGLIILQQDGTGSRTLSLESYYHTPGNVAPTLSTGANDIDVIPYYIASSTSILLGQLTRDIS